MACTGTVRYKTMLDGQMCPVLISQADFWYPVVSSAFDESITLFFNLVVGGNRNARAHVALG